MELRDRVEQKELYWDYLFKLFLESLEVKMNFFLSCRLIADFFRESNCMFASERQIVLLLR